MQNTTDPDCFSLTSFNLIVNPLPPVDSFEDVVVCESYTLQPLTNGNYFTGPNGTGDQMFAGDMIGETMTVYIFNQPGGPDSCNSATSFEVTIIDPLTLSPLSGSFCTSYTLPPLSYGNYHTESGGNGTEIDAGTVITTSQIVYVYYVTITEPFCVIDTDFIVTILPSPEVGTFSDIFDCSSYTLPPLNIGKYYTEPNGGGTEIASGTIITTTQTVYVYATNAGTPTCSDSDDFNIYVGFEAPADINQCDPYTLPTLPIGTYFTGPNGTGTPIAAATIINTPQTIYIYIANSNSPNCMSDMHFSIATSQPAIDTIANVVSCVSYTLPVLTNGAYYTETGGSGTQLNAGDIITTNQTVYIYAAFSPTCANESSFTISINAAPMIDSRSDIDICNAYILTDLTIGNYYTGSNGTGTMLPAGTVITTTQTIYIYAASTNSPPCIAQNTFEINIFSIEADAPIAVTACDSYVLQPLTIGNYYQNSGGPLANTSMLNAGDVITQSTTLYIYTESGERINCIDENNFSITINDTPVVTPVSDKFACNSYTLPTLALGNYYSGAGATGTMMNAGNVLTSSQVVYVYAATGTTPNCSSEQSFQVVIHNVDQMTDITTCENYVLPELTVGQYYTGPNGTGTHLNSGQAVAASGTIYVYGVAPFLPGCPDETSFVLTVIDTPVAYAVAANITTICDQDGTNDGIANFILSDLNAGILGTQTGAEFSIA